MSNPFIGLEDEIDLRRAVRAIHKHEGWAGIWRAIGELARSLEIVGDIVIEIHEEEKKKGGNSDV